MSGMVTDPMSPCVEQAVFYEEWVSKSLSFAAEAQQREQERLRGMFGAGVDIDEMAVMFTSLCDLRFWVDAAVRVPGISLFNTAYDTVKTGPISSQYDVHYWFLSVPENYGSWRMEVMFAHSGSPLHDSIARSMPQGQAVLVHASFKCPDEESYGVSVNTLRRNDYELAQRCDSTYGKFSYWRRPEENYGVMLKPRVNLRDTGDDDE